VAVATRRAWCLAAGLVSPGESGVAGALEGTWRLVA